MANHKLEHSTTAIVLYEIYALALHQKLVKLGVKPGVDYSIASLEGKVKR